MPSQEHLKQKQAIIDEISEKMQKARGVVVLDYIGITVEQADTLRGRLRDAGLDYKVYKNTLVKRAIEGTDNAGLAGALDGPSAFAFGYEDAIAPARVLDGAIKEFKKMEFKAGLVEGVLYDADGIKQIATIPSKDVLIARFMGSIQSPISKLVRTFAAIADAGEGGAEAPADEAPADEAAAEEAAAETGEAPAEEPAAEAPNEEAAADVGEAPAEAPADEAAAEESAAETGETPAAETAEAAEAPAEDPIAETAEAPEVEEE
jgi:large subunit ribosomal protein L10